MKGSVNSKLVAIVELRLLDKNGREQIVEAIVDTGFNGYLTLPTNIIGRLDCPYLGRGHAVLADGSEDIFNIYEVDVLWDNQLKQVEVDVVECTPLLGMALLENYSIQISVIAGGKVLILPLP